MTPEFYLDLSNIKIGIKQGHADISFQDVYKAFNYFFSEEYENIIPGQSVEKLKSKSEKYTENIFNNIISVYDYNQDIERQSKQIKEINYVKINAFLKNLKEIIPENIQYLRKEDMVDLDGTENEINSALFKRNKFGLYFNAFDEVLLYEIIAFNKLLEEFHMEINILLGMLEGKYSYDEYHLRTFEILKKGKVPKELNIFYEIQKFNKNIKFPLFKNVLLNRISIFKQWLREGKMNCYHLPLFTNPELFIYCIKMHFCQKYYGENDYSKVTPEMINLKFITTRFPTYEELAENEKEFNYYNTIYHNEIIWVDGLVLNNASIDPSNKHLIFSNLENDLKQKLNIVGIVYNIRRFENNDQHENEEENEEEEEEEEEEEGEKEQNEENDEKKENKGKSDEDKVYKKIMKKNKEEIFQEDNQSVKIYIYGNKGNVMTNKYYNEDPIGFFEFKMINNDINGQGFINENNIRITIDDYDDFEQSST